MKEAIIKLGDIEFIKEYIIIVEDFNDTWCPEKHKVIVKKQFKNFKDDLRGWSRVILNKDIKIRFVDIDNDPEYFI